MDGVVELYLPSSRPRSGMGRNADGLTERFIVGPENRLLLPAVRAILEQPPNGYNPIVLYGPSGVGKTRLAEGLAASCKASNRHTICTTAVDFGRDLAEAIETQSLEEFRTKHRNASYWFLEDLHLLVSRKPTSFNPQEEILNTIDALLRKDSWVVVTAAVAPAELKGLPPALRGRLTGGLTVRISPPGLRARVALLKHLADARGLHLAEEALQVIAVTIADIVPALDGVLNRLAVKVQVESQKPTLTLVKQLLAQQPSKSHVKLAEIARATAQYFSLRLKDLCSTRRQQTLVTARGIVAYLARQYAHEPFTKIAQYLGHRDHTTIIHSYRKIKEHINHDEAVRNAVMELQAALWKN